MTLHWRELYQAVFVHQLLIARQSRWAISVHKAQGSAFRRVIIPIVPSKLLDRTMLYTAITRAVETVVLVGDIDHLNEVVCKSPRSLDRTAALDFTLEI